MTKIVKKIEIPLNLPIMPHSNVKQNMNETKFFYVYACVLFFILFYNGVVWLSAFSLYF